MSDETGLCIRTLSNRWIGLGESLSCFPTHMPIDLANITSYSLHISPWPAAAGIRVGSLLLLFLLLPGRPPLADCQVRDESFARARICNSFPPFARKWRFRMRASDRGHLNLHTRTVRKVGSRLCDNLLCLAAFTQPSETQYGVEREGEREEWWYQGTFPFP